MGMESDGIWWGGVSRIDSPAPAPFYPVFPSTPPMLSAGAATPFVIPTIPGNNSKADWIANGFTVPDIIANDNSDNSTLNLGGPVVAPQYLNSPSAALSFLSGDKSPVSNVGGSTRSTGATSPYSGLFDAPLNFFKKLMGTPVGWLVIGGLLYLGYKVFKRGNR